MLLLLQSLTDKPTATGKVYYHLNCESLLITNSNNHSSAANLDP